MADWFKKGCCEMIAMESTASYWKPLYNILEHLLSGRQIDSTEYDILYEKKIIAHNLKATKEQIIDDLNGVMSDIQRKMMKTPLKHLDELNAHIKELDDDIDNFMKPEEKDAANMIQDIPGIGNTSTSPVRFKRLCLSIGKKYHPCPQNVSTVVL